MPVLHGLEAIAPRDEPIAQLPGKEGTRAPIENLATSKLVRVPPLYCPFPAALHPAVEVLHRQGMDFMRCHGFCATDADEKAVMNIDAGRFTARWFPDGSTPPERLQLVTDLLWMYFRLDDLRFELLGQNADASATASFMYAQLQIWEHPQAYTPEGLDPFSQGTLALSNRLVDLATPTQAARWRKAMARWFLGLQPEGAVLQRSDLTLEEYIPLRLVTVGGRLMLDVVGFVGASHVPSEVWDTRLTQAACQAGMFVALCDNEIFSHFKENWTTADEPPKAQAPNLIHIVQRETDSSPEEATRQVADHRNQAMRLYLHLREVTTAYGSPALNAYVRLLDQVIRGNLEYHMTGTRYHNPDGLHPHAVSYDVEVLDTCPTARHTPPTHSIAWWWDQLDVAL